MAKKAKVTDKVIETVTDKVVADISGDLSSLTKEQLVERYEMNVLRRKELAEENKQLVILYKAATKVAKQAKAEKQIADAMAKLEALKAAAVSAGVDVEETPVEAPAVELA